MIHIFSHQNGMERILLYKRHIGSSIIFNKEEKRWSKNWSVEDSAIHFVAIAFAATVKCTNHCWCGKKQFQAWRWQWGRSIMGWRQELIWSGSAESARTTQKNPLLLINLDPLDWKESQCDKPTRFSYMLPKEFNRLGNRLVHFAENQLASQENTESLRAY